MENSKFLTVTNEKGEKAVFFENNGNYGWSIHATPADSQTNNYGKKVGEESTDVELLKLWNHATIERKFNVYASKPVLEKELIRRGYVLTENKHRWKRLNQTEMTEA